MSAERRYLSIISGQARGVGAALARGGLLALEPLYRGIVGSRNTLFDARVKPAHPLGRPTVSVGNITTGGTGKTPIVQWLTNELIQHGHRPAILLRGYRAHDGLSDEAELLKQPGLEVQADPDRCNGAKTVLERAPATSVFVLDDGFQHRRAARDFDLVLIDATNPFGHDHVIPRGLLREPPSGLARAQAIVITRADAVGDRLPELVARIRRYAPTVPIYQSNHVFGGLLTPAGLPIDVGRAGRVLAIAGIGNPEPFYESLRRQGLDVADVWSPGDHYVYTPADLDRLRGGKSFDTVVVTDKDWVKLRCLEVETIRIARAMLRIDFADGHGKGLLEQILTATGGTVPQTT